LAATLHDIGKIGVPDNILMKPGLLTEVEIATMQAHTQIGHEIVSPSTDEIMKVAAAIALSHHERWDGSGLSLQARRGGDPDRSPHRSGVRCL